jgi:hypothetical protein
VRTCVRGQRRNFAGRLQRALQIGDPLTAITAAADCERLVLDDAPALALLLLRTDEARGGRAVARAVGPTRSSFRASTWALRPRSGRFH